MSIPPPYIDATGRRSARRATRRATAANQPSSYRLEVHARDVADLVAFAGGWLYDHITAGWHVNVDVGGDQNVRPLQILGIRTQRRATTSPPDDQAIITVVPGPLLDSDQETLKIVTTALRRGDEVMVWGDQSDAERRYRLHDANYRLSGAAQVFKAHALLASGRPADSAAAIEVFRSRSGSNAVRRPLGDES